jgi:hypothetical protein
LSLCVWYTEKETREDNCHLGADRSHQRGIAPNLSRPAIVNCAGIFREVRDNDRLRLDGSRGLVEVLEEGRT